MSYDCSHKCKIICKYICRILLLPLLSAFFLLLSLPSPGRLPETGEQVCPAQGQGWREWEACCAICLLTSFLMVYVCVMRCGVSFLPLKHRSKTAASIHSSLTILHCFCKIWEFIVSQCPSYRYNIDVPGGLELEGFTRTAKNASSTQSDALHENQQCSPTGRKIQERVFFTRLSAIFRVPVQEHIQVLVPQRLIWWICT